MSKLVTVFGASGFLGRHVVRELCKRGWRVRAAVRRPHTAQFLQVMGVPGQVQLYQANIRYPESIAGAMRGADAAVNLVGILAEGGKQRFAALQAEGPRDVAEICAAEGIQDLVHVSAIGADPHSDSEYARSKAAGEENARAALPSTVILRPSIVFGPQDEFFNRFASMARLSPALPLIGGGKTRFQPVYVDDVADAVVAALAEPAHRGKTFELGGPEVMTFRELMELMLKIIGRSRMLVPVPFPVAGMMGRGGELAGKLPFVVPPLTTDQVRLLKRDNVVARDALGFDALGIVPDTMDAVLPTYLYRYRKQGQFSPEVPV